MTTSVSSSLIYELRGKTGAPIMACKKALVQVDGDLAEAEKIILADAKNKAEKKKDRVTASGTVFAYSGKEGGSLVEIKSETDFVARNELFQKFAATVCELVYETQTQTIESLNDLKLSTGQTVEQARSEMVLQLGENIQVSRCFFMPSEGDSVTHYIHGQKIAVILRWKGSAEVGENIAMQVAASAPLGLTKEDIPAKVMQDETDVFKMQVKELNKPAEVAEKILEGKIHKFVDAKILGGQEFICDTKMKVRDYLKKEGAEVTAFERMELGVS